MDFFFDHSEPWTDLGDGIRRKIVGQTPELMPLLVQSDTGAVSTVHAHDAHDQIAYCLSVPSRPRGPASGASSARGGGNGAGLS